MQVNAFRQYNDIIKTDAFVRCDTVYSYFESHATLPKGL